MNDTRSVKKPTVFVRSKWYGTLKETEASMPWWRLSYEQGHDERRSTHAHVRINSKLMAPWQRKDRKLSLSREASTIF